MGNKKNTPKKRELRELDYAYLAEHSHGPIYEMLRDVVVEESQKENLEQRLYRKQVAA